MYESLARRVQDSKRATRYGGFPAKIRSEVVKAAAPLIDDGHSVRDVAGRLGVSSSTLYRWLKEEEARPGFRSVTVVAPEPSPSSSPAPSPSPPSSPSRSYSMTSPAGFVVEGLGLEDVATLLGQLR